MVRILKVIICVNSACCLVVTRGIRMSAIAVKIKPNAVLGAIRPGRTLPSPIQRCSSFKSIPKFLLVVISIKVRPHNININTPIAVCKCMPILVFRLSSSRAIPLSVKQSAVLNTMGTSPNLNCTRMGICNNHPVSTTPPMAMSIRPMNILSTLCITTMNPSGGGYRVWLHPLTQTLVN